MRPRSDAMHSVSRSKICEIGGVNRQTREKWVSRGLLSDRDPCGELDLIELVVLNALSGTIRKGHVPIAWNQIQPKLSEAIPTAGLMVVWDVQARKAAFAFDDASIVELVSHGRPVHVVDLAAPIEAARAALRNELAASGRKPKERGGSSHKGTGRFHGT